MTNDAPLSVLETNRMIRKLTITHQAEFCDALIRGLNALGIDTDELDTMVLLDALGVAGLSLMISEEASKTFVRLLSKNNA